MVFTLELSPLLVLLGVGLLVAVPEVLVPPVGATLLAVPVELSPEPVELAVPLLTLFPGESPVPPPVPELFTSPTLLLLPLSVTLFPLPNPGL